MFERILKILIVLIILLTISTMVSSCRTVSGVAGDLSWGFNKIDEAIVVPD